MASQIQSNSIVSSQVNELTQTSSNSLKQKANDEAANILLVDVSNEQSKETSQNENQVSLTAQAALSNDDKERELQEAIKVISDFMELSTKNVNFLQDDSSEKTVIKVFDAQSKELIKQFPSEEILAIAHKIIELRQDVGEKTGILLDEKV